MHLWKSHFVKLQLLIHLLPYLQTFVAKVHLHEVGILSNLYPFPLLFVFKFSYGFIVSIRGITISPCKNTYVKVARSNIFQTLVKQVFCLLQQNIPLLYLHGPFCLKTSLTFSRHSSRSLNVEDTNIRAILSTNYPANHSKSTLKY